MNSEWVLIAVVLVVARLGQLPRRDNILSVDQVREP